MSRLVDDRAEHAVLASLLVRPACWADVSGLVDPTTFGNPRHRAIADAIWAIRRRGDADADYVTILAELATRGTERLAGEVLMTLDSDRLPSAPIKHARKLRELAAARRMLEVVGEIADDFKAAERDPSAWLEDVARKVTAAADVRRESELVHVGTLVQRHAAEIKGRAEGVRRGLSTGIASFDAMTGGLHTGEFCVIAARPSSGKSAIAMQFATHIAEDNRTPVAFFSSEMKSIAVLDRLVAERGNVALHRLRDGKMTEDEFRGVLEAYGKLQRSGVWISDRRGWRVNELVAQARAWKREHCKVRPDGTQPQAAVFVDYLQIVRASERHTSREQEIAEVSRVFQAFAGEENVALVVLAQLVREAEKRGADTPPQLADLRESGSIEQDADAVMFVHRPDRIDSTIEAGATVFAIGKQRQGECGTIPLWFQGRYQRFVHRDRDYTRTGGGDPRTTKAGDNMRQRGRGGS